MSLTKVSPIVRAIMKVRHRREGHTGKASPSARTRTGCCSK
jgi:hypothetical protein